MNRLKKELVSRGMIYENDDDDAFGAWSDLITVTGKYIIMLWGCNVLPQEIHLFDAHTYKLIGTQNLIPEDMLFQEGKTWNSQIWAE